MLNIDELTERDIAKAIETSGVASMGDLFLATMRETLYRRSLPLATRDLVLRLSMLGELAGVIGLAELVSDELFAGDHLAELIEFRRPAPADAVAAGGSR